jgi:crossover junction endodeoxyribonuclease RusA
MIFNVLGLTPAPQGSKRHVGGGRMVESSAKVKPWREAVRQEALKTGHAITAEPVYIHLLFRFRRPRGHYNTRGILKPSAPHTPTTRPDLDKLCRSTLDGLTGVLFHDDSQVAFMVASKQYAAADELEGVEIEVREMTAPTLYPAAPTP